MPIARPRRDRFLLLIALLTFAVWLFSISTARTWAARSGSRGNWFVGVAPSFFAGLTFAFWNSYWARSAPITSAAIAAVIVTLAEVAQIFIPRYTADPWDAVAGIVGAALALPILMWRAKERMTSSAMPTG